MDAGNKTPNLNLPPPIPQGVEAAPAVPETAGPKGMEAAPIPAKEVAAAPAMPVVPAIPQVPTSRISVQPSTSQASSGLPAIADDNDLIEKEWVVKAKQIVEKTKNDPHKQNKELNVFKADYMQKRYNKTIKLSE